MRNHATGLLLRYSNRSTILCCTSSNDSPSRVARPCHMFGYKNGLESKSQVTTTTESSLTLRLTYSVTVAYNPQEIVTGRSCKPRRSLHPRLFVTGTDEHPAF